MVSREFEAFPDAKEMVVDVAKDMRLSACIRLETLMQVGTGGKWGNDCGVALFEPAVGPPPQKCEDPPHLFPKE